MTTLQIINSICNYLDDYGWKYHIHNESTIISGFVDNNLKEHTLLFSENVSVLFLTSHITINIKENTELSKYALLVARANYEATITKFALSETNDIVVSIEIPSEQINKDTFLECLEIFCGYIEKFTVILHQENEILSDNLDSQYRIFS